MSAFIDRWGDFLLGVLMGLALAITAVGIYNTVQFDMQCDGEIIENWYGKERCVTVVEER